MKKKTKMKKQKTSWITANKISMLIKQWNCFSAVENRLHLANKTCRRYEAKGKEDEKKKKSVIKTPSSTLRYISVNTFYPWIEEGEINRHPQSSWIMKGAFQDAVLMMPASESLSLSLFLQVHPFRKVGGRWKRGSEPTTKDPFSKSTVAVGCTRNFIKACISKNPPFVLNRPCS